MYKYTPKKYLVTGFPIQQEIPEDSIPGPQGLQRWVGPNSSPRGLLWIWLRDKIPQVGRLEMGSERPKPATVIPRMARSYVAKNRVRKDFVKQVVCFIVTVLRYRLCHCESCRSTSNARAVLVAPSCSSGSSLLWKKLGSQCGRFAKIFSGLRFG